MCTSLVLWLVLVWPSLDGANTGDAPAELGHVKLNELFNWTKKRRLPNLDVGQAKGFTVEFIAASLQLGW